MCQTKIGAIKMGCSPHFLKEKCEMKNINIIIKDAFGREIKTNTEYIEEDVLRMRMGLEPQEQEGE